MRHRPILVSGVLLTLVAAGTGCDMLGGNKPASSGSTGGTAAPAVAVSVPANEILATVNGVPISTGDLELRIQELKALVQQANQTWKPITTEQLTALLEDIINSEVMTQAAQSAKLDQTADVQRRMAYARRQLMTQQWAKSMQDKLTVSAEEIEGYYNQNKAGFKEPPKAKFRHIVVDTEADAKRALASLFGESADFSSLAQQISVGPEAGSGGDMDNWVMRGQDAAQVFRNVAEAEQAGVTVLERALESAAFSVTEPNGISNYAKGADDKYHIFQLVEKQEGAERELNAVYDNIKAFLTIQKVQEAILQLKNSAKIEKNLDRLEDVEQ